MNDSRLDPLVNSKPSASIELIEDGRLRVSGELSFKTVPALISSSQVFFKKNNDIDLADVSRADSAGVALLIEWRRQAQKQNKSVCFSNIPSQMLAIARLSGVNELLSLKS
jgi:phospholipid transport system transporter-binding protein